jgi:signal transduction histidine kinase
MRGVLQRIERNGKHLLGLINDVLDLSKIEAGQLVLSLSDYSMKSVVQTVFTAVEPLAVEKRLGFTIDVAPNLPQGHGDERRLTQVLLNLVGNAIKFTDTGEVAITASAADGAFHVAVRDTGPGIPAGDQAKLFQEFVQADTTVAQQKGGPAWGSRSRSGSSRCMEERSGSSRSSARAPPFPSRSRSGWSSELKQPPASSPHSHAAMRCRTTASSSS